MPVTRGVGFPSAGNLLRVSRGDLDARVTGQSNVELLELLKKMTNDTIESVAREMSRRKDAEIKLEETYQTVKKGHDDSLSILNMLRLGIATINESGEITFLNKTANDLFGKHKSGIIGRRWHEVVFLSDEDQDKLTQMLRHTKARKRLQAQVEFLEANRYWMDIEVQDDPRNPRKQILFLYLPVSQDIQLYSS